MLKIKDFFKKNEKILFIYLFIYFLVFSFILIKISSTYSYNVFLEIFKYGQILIFIFFLNFSFGKNKTAPILLNTFFLCLYLLVLGFFITVGLNLDFNFFYHNLSGLSFVWKNYYKEIFIFLFLSFIFAVFVSKINLRFCKRKLRLLFVLYLIILFLIPLKLNNRLIYFLKTSYQKDEIINFYQNNVYKKAIDGSIKNKDDILDKAKIASNIKHSDSLDNIIFLQLESLDSFLVDEKNTPNFLNFSKKGVYFPFFYNNNVETITGQESILCGTPPSFYGHLNNIGLDKKVLCLPEVLKAMDYKTFFFKTYNLKFTDTGDFMKNIGFDEVHSKDVMEDGDPEYVWGYREDIFYKRALDFFEEKKGEKNLLYLEVGPTNHWPFERPNDFNQALPFEEVSSYREKLANSTYIQDFYLKDVWDNIHEIFPENNFTLVILSDQAWPIGFHGNYFNQRGSYEENFLSPLIFYSPKNDIKKVVKTKYSQADILPSFLDLFGIDENNNNFSQSFKRELYDSGEANKQHKIITIQPFGEKYLNIIDGDLKYQYESKNKEFIKYDLEDYPREQGEVLSEYRDSFLDNLLSFNNG